MAEYTIDKFTYGGNTYKLQDNVSGYTTNTGTVQFDTIEEATAPPISIAGGGTSATTAAQAILNLGIYPIGSIYISVSSTFNPATAFGGTWERIEDTFLLAAGSTYAGGSTGGSATVTLTVDEMPSHKHTFNNGYSSNGEYLYSMNDSHSGSNTGLSHYPYGGANTTLNNTGGGLPHENMPPYLAVYVWKRTA